MCFFSLRDEEEGVVCLDLRSVENLTTALPVFTYGVLLVAGTGNYAAMQGFGNPYMT